MARRTVSVALEVKAAEARREIHGTADETRKLEASVVATGRGLDKMSERAREAGRASEKMAAGEQAAKRETEALNRELGQLDRQIDATVLHLKVLGREFAATGDKTLLKKISADRSMLRQLSQIRKSLAPQDVASGGIDLGALRGLMAPMIGVLVGAAVLAAPGIGAALAGAALGGVGAGGMVGGIVAAAQDGRVKDAFAHLGDRLSEAFAAAGRPFLGPLLHEVSQLEATAGSGLRILEAGFKKLAPLVHPLALGIDGFVTALGPGLGKAFEAAKPLIRALANELPRIAAAISDALTAMSEESDGAVMGMIALSRTFEALVRGGGELIATLSRIFESSVRTAKTLTEMAMGYIDVFGPLAGVGNVARDKLEDLHGKTVELLDGLAAAKDGSNDFSQSLEGTATTANEAAQKVKDLSDAVDDLLHKQLSWDEAQISLRQGMRELIKELTEGKRTLATNYAEGDKNRAAIEQQIGTVIAAAEAYRAWSGDIAGANHMRDVELEKIRAELIHLGYNRAAVNAVIDAYIRAGKITASPKLETPGLITAQTRLKKVEDTLNRLDGSVAVATVLVQEFRRESAREYRRRWGGISEREGGAYEHAAVGRLREAAVYSAQAPARYAFAEPSTGGEGFVPKRGNYQRSMSIISREAAWYGASVVPGGGYAHPGGGVQTIIHEHRHTLVLEGTSVLSGLRTEIGYLGGDVQTALGSRARVGG